MIMNPNEGKMKDEGKGEELIDERKASKDHPIPSFRSPWSLGQDNGCVNCKEENRPLTLIVFSLLFTNPCLHS